MSTVNLNDAVEVILTKVGAEMLTSHFRKYGQVKTYEAGMVFRGQLWYIIAIFKDQMGLGMESPFEGCQIFLDKRVVDKSL